MTNTPTTNYSGIYKASSQGNPEPIVTIHIAPGLASPTQKKAGRRFWEKLKTGARADG